MRVHRHPGQLHAIRPAPPKGRPNETDLDPIVMLDRLIARGLRVEMWSPQPKLHKVRVVGSGIVERSSMVDAIRVAYRINTPQQGGK